MKTNFRFLTRVLNTSFGLTAILAVGLMSSCDDDDPEREDAPELVTKVTLRFTPIGGGTAITATATDPDGRGIQNLTTDGPITLAANTNYQLTVEMVNELLSPSHDDYDVSDEVRDDGDEHMFFYAWTNGLFTDPAGDGNIDNRADEVAYNDEDERGRPIGLRTLWTTAEASTGKFRILLKHQPGIKSDTSTSSMGETDLDIEFDIEIQ